MAGLTVLSHAQLLEQRLSRRLVRLNLSNASSFCWYRSQVRKLTLHRHSSWHQISVQLSVNARLILPRVQLARLRRASFSYKQELRSLLRVSRSRASCHCWVQQTLTRPAIVMPSTKVWLGAVFAAAPGRPGQTYLRSDEYSRKHEPTCTKATLSRTRG